MHNIETAYCDRRRVVCVSVCVRQMGELCKMGELIKMPFLGLTHVGGPKELCIRWGPDPQEKGQF